VTETNRSTRRAKDGATGLTEDEREAMKERLKELKAARKGASREDGERDILAKIAEMPEPDRTMADRIHTLVKAAAPDLVPRTWYGMPAYSRDGNVVCFFQSAAKFKARYATFGFNDPAKLDDGPMWATSFALRELTPESEATIAALVRKAVG
jgi:uncharacterized protein YdhG (YjbR/CyaY superfamily)